MRESGWRSVLRYRFDSFMSKGGASIFLSLLVLFLGSLVIVGGIRGALYLLYPAGGAGMDGLLGHIWTVFLEMTDPGNMGEDTGSSTLFKVAAVLSGVAGVIIFSMLIAFLTTTLDQKIGQLKKGHSKVMESGHTLVLGWNDRVVEILRELVDANESEDDPCAVVLSERDKEEMDDYLALHLPERKNTRVVTRSGSTSALVSLDTVAVGSCKSVIVLAGCGEGALAEDKAASDARVVKTVLAVTASRPEGKKFNIVAEVFDPRNRDVVEGIAPQEVTTVDTQDVLARILVQTSRSSGLAVVYTEILGFAGNEMYFSGADWGRTTFGRVQFHFRDGIVLGVRRAGGDILLNPAPGTPMAPGDEVVMLASDNSAIRFEPQPVAAPRDLPLRPGRLESKVERTLILGWNSKAAAIIEQYAQYVREGSAIDVMVRGADPGLRETVAAMKRDLAKIRLSLVEKDPMRLENLAGARPFEYDSVVVLSQGGESDDPERVDSETIIVLLLLRRVFADNPDRAGTTKLITEVMDSENQELVARAGVNDFIISNRLVSKLFAQISEQREIKRVYDDLFREEGSELYLKPVSLYLERLPFEASFADLMALAQKREEVCLGVRRKTLEHDWQHNFGVTLNPDKDARFTLAPGDALVVLAENDS